MAFAMFLFIGFSGCEGDLGVNNDFSLSDLNSDEFAVPDFADVEANIQDATIESDMAMNPVFGQGGKFQRRGGYRGGKGGHIGGILRQLGITEDQGAAIKELISAHRESMKETFEALREANTEIFEQTKADRQVIIDAMKAGEITREEARAQLHELSTAKREAVANNPESAPLLQAICDAKLALFADVRALLDETQATAWDEWVTELDGPCFGG